MKKIAIIGSRDVIDYNFVDSCFTNVLMENNIMLNNIVIVSGGARGVDNIAQQIARNYGLPILIFYPNWKKYGKKAGLIRNKKIIENSNIVIAISSKNSRGTWDSINKAKKLKKKLYIFKYDK